MSKKKPPKTEKKKPKRKGAKKGSNQQAPHERTKRLEQIAVCGAMAHKSEREIAAMMDISIMTLRKHYGDIMKAKQVDLFNMSMGTLAKKIHEGHFPAISFYLSTKHGFNKTQVIEDDRSYTRPDHERNAADIANEIIEQHGQDD